jgi:alanine dehydrogenase
VLTLNAEAIRRIVALPRLIDRLEDVFRSDTVVPPRQIVTVPGGAGDRLFVSMLAFDLDGNGAVKLATVFPSNPSSGLPTVQAAIVLFSEKGTPVALLDGTSVTYLRTGAASALASKYLSRKESAHLVVLGTGALAPVMAAAHCAVRPIRRVSVWGRRQERARITVDAIRASVASAVLVDAVSEAQQAVSSADIVSCATNSPTPILAGKWLRPGTFVDLVGSFSPTSREADDDVMSRSRIFVDTFQGAFAEAGDILDPLSRGLIARDRVEGELSDLIRGRVKGRVNGDEITVFKSVGTAIEDLAAARMIVAGCM